MTTSSIATIWKTCRRTDGALYPTPDRTYPVRVEGGLQLGACILYGDHVDPGLILFHGERLCGSEKVRSPGPCLCRAVSEPLEANIQEHRERAN